MKKFSKLFWVALVVVAVLACTAIGVFAAETTSTAVVYADSVEVADNFSVDVKYKDNSAEVECGKITLTWDASKMTAKDIVPSDALNGAQFGVNTNEEGKAVIAWAGSAIGANTTGTLFTVNFAKGNIAADGYAAINIAVDDFGYTNGFKAVEATVAANKFFATGEDVVDENGEMVYTAESGDAADFLEIALGQAATTKKDVTVLVSSEMTFTESVKIGEATYNDEAGTVYISAALDAEGKPTTGIKIYANAIVDFYGNVNFNNILIGNTHYKYGVTLPPTVEEFKAGTGKQSGTSGGCLQFTKGMGTFGHANTGTDDAPNYGFIDIYPDEKAYQLNSDETAVEQVSERCGIHISGHVTVYTGWYWTITGNYCGSGVQVNNPKITLCGEAEANSVYGGVYYTTSNPIEGASDIDILDSAFVGTLFGGSFRGRTVVNGADILINTTGTITNFTLGHENNNVSMDYKNVEYKVTIKNGTVGTANGTFNAYRAQAGTASNCNFVYDIQGGTIKASPFFGMNTTTSMNSMAIEGKVDIDISGGTFTNNNYFGSYLNYDFKTSPDKSHQAMDRLVRDIDITGGQFNGAVYFGSYIKAPNNSKHEGATDIKITNGTFKKGIHGGSLFAGSDGQHIGEVTITLQGAEGKMINFGGGHVAGGSGFNYTYKGVDGATEICQRNYHVGKTTIYLKDIVYLHADDTSLGLTNNMSNINKFFAGSNLNGVTGSAENRNEHKGNSQLIIQRSAIGDRNMRFYGGSRIDGDYNVHSGTSSIIVDANTGWDSVNKVETPNVGGWARITDVLFGGCLLNGSISSDYADNTDITSAQTQVKQLGKSEVQLIGPKDRVADQYNHKLDIVNRRVIGGVHYAASYVKTRHTCDSEIYIENYVDSAGAQRISAGPYYNNQAFTDTTVDRVPTSRVVVNGTYSGPVACGGEVYYKTAGQEYITNTALVLLPGANLLKDPNLGNHNAGGIASSTSGAIIQKGTQLLEVHAGTPEFVDNARFALNLPGVLKHDGNKCAKFVGSFADTDGDKAYTVYTPFYASNLDITQASGASTLNYLQLKYNSGNWETTTTRYHSGSANLFERITNSKIIKFVEAGSTTTAYTEIKVKPGMKFADLLATEGLMFYTNYTGTTNYPRVLDYALSTSYDAGSKSPNAFEFYLADDAGKATGEPLKTVPADRNQAIVVKSGTVYSKAFLLNYENIVVGGTVTNAASDVTVQLIKKGETEAAYEATVTPAEGSAAYSFDYVTEGTYTLKVTSEGYNIYTKEITVTAEDITEDVVLKAKAVFPETKGMTASLNLIDEIKINFDYELVGMADLNINDFDPAKFGLLVWQTAKFDGTLDTTTAIHSAINTKNGDEILTGSEVVYELNENTKYPNGRWRTTTPGIPAAMWGDTITIRPFYINEDGTYSYGRVINYSVKQYCMNKIRNNNSEKALCVSILNYGSAAQTYFNYNTETMMNAELSVELQTFNWDDYKAMVDLDYSVSSTKEGELARVSTTVVPLRKGSITLNGILDYNFYANVNFEPVSVKAYFWDHEAYNNNDVLTPENVSRVVDAEWTEEHGGCYIGKYTEVPAAHMFNNVYGCLAFEAEDGSITYSGVVAYSPARYAKLNADKTGNAQILNEANLSKAIVVYGATAKEYFGV